MSKIILKTRTKAIITAIILMLTITSTSLFVALPSTSAHSPSWTVPTNAYIQPVPDTVGVGQSVTLVCWLDRYSPTNGGNNGQVWTGWQINITQPDGKTVIIGPWTCASAVASDWKTFTPTEVGTYKMVFSWPGGVVAPSLATYSSVDTGDIFLGATSDTNYLYVQQNAVPSYPETPLPSDYWTRPINGQNRLWSSLASNYLKGAWLVEPGFQNEGTGPASAHVMWTEPILATSPTSGQGYPGGIADAQWPGMVINTNDYNTPWSAPIIMNGIIYQNMPSTSESSKYGYYATDLQTGQQLWFKNGTDNGLNNPYIVAPPGGSSYPYGQEYYMLSQGQILHVYNVNGNGIAEYLWMQGVMGTWSNTMSTGTWYMLDPTTGDVILTLTNVPTGTAATDAQGDLLIYSYNSAKGQFLCWNTTQAIYRASPTSTGEQQWRPANGAVIDAQNDTAWVNASTTWGTGLDPLMQTALKTPHSGYSMNVTDNSLKGLQGSIKVLSDSKREPRQIFGSAITTTYGSIGGSCTGDSIQIWLATINEGATSFSPWPTLPCELNTNLGFTVTLNYNKNFTVPLPGRNDTWSIPCINYDARIFTLMDQQTTQIWCYNLDTGALMWGPTAKMSPMGYYNTGGGEGWAGNVYYGIYLAMDTENFPGELFAYNVTNGNLLWSYNSTASPYNFESIYGANMPMLLEGVCDGMVYMCSSEHNPTNPIWRQSYIRCINITDGTLIWKLQDFYGLYGWQGGGGVGLPIADGYMVTWSQYDNLVYCIGKGPSGLTVSAPQSDIPQGSSFTISGTVTDQSPGAKAYAAKFGVSNGVAAVSDDSQEAFMEYLYEQQSKPTNTTGVSVRISAIDPNGNYVNLGTTTSDATGFYSFTVDPSMLSAGAGKYTVVANFDGSKSYGSSSSECAFTLNAAAPTPTNAPLAVQPPTEMYFVASTIAIILAIAIGFALTILVLRKRA